MKFKLEIDCGNAAFGGSVEERNFEVARILKEVAEKFENERTATEKVYDVNGAVVGSAKFIGFYTGPSR